MQIFQVIPNGEVHEILDADKPIVDLLDSNESYIICDDEARIVYLWKGLGSKVRSKFIGARKLQDVRSQVGLNYRSTSMDEEEVVAGDFPEFSEAIKNPRADGFAREIREDGDDVQYNIENGNPPPKPKSYSNLNSNNLNQNLQQTGPIYTGDDGSLSSYSSAQQSGVKPYSKVELEKIIDILDEDEIPDGFEREMVIIGDTSYSVTEKVQSFLGKKTIEHQLEPISTLPEGVFFAEGYVPRVLVQDQTVVAIEFLRKKE